MDVIELCGQIIHMFDDRRRRHLFLGCEHPSVRFGLKILPDVVNRLGAAKVDRDSLRVIRILAAVASRTTPRFRAWPTEIIGQKAQAQKKAVTKAGIGVRISNSPRWLSVGMCGLCELFSGALGRPT